MMFGLITLEPVSLPVRSASFVAQGACSACPYRTRCHEARQHAMDPRGLGRHTSCDFYREFERRVPVPRGVISRLRAWVRHG